MIQVSDNFARVAGTLGANWTNFNNGFSANNAAVGTLPSGVALNIAAYTGISFTNDQSSTVVLGSAIGAAAVGAAVRVSGTPGTTTSFYLAQLTATTLTLYKIIGATPTTFGTLTTLAGPTAVTGVVGDKIRLSVVGTTLTVDYNSSMVILQASDTTLTSGAPGISQDGTVTSISSFSAVSQAVAAGVAGSVICDGDSITYGFGTPTPWPTLLALNNGKGPWSVSNVGVSAKGLGVVTTISIQSMITTGPTSVDTLFSGGIRNIVVAWGGTNDFAFNGRTPAQVYADLQTYVAARKAAGFKVVIVPMLSRAVVDSSVQTYNALLAGNSSFADAIVALPPTLVGAGAFSNTTYFQPAGQVHPTQFAATNIIAPAISATINKLFYYSQPDCRNYGVFPNLPENLQGTAIFDIPAQPSTTAPVDSRAPGFKPVDSRNPAYIRTNSRAPGTYGPGN